MSRLPAFFLSHGGGPWPYLEGPARAMHAQLETSLKAVLPSLNSPVSAVLVATAHWETPAFALSSGARPGMVYDYNGFPEHTYRVRYEAPGDPALAEQALGLLADAGIGCALDPDRGFDHGTFSLMAAMRPQADLPIVQLSIRQDFDPAPHIDAGRALAPLREEGVLLIGSGFSYHNLSRFGPEARVASQAFDAWLNETLLNTSAGFRRERLLQWQSAPAAREVHPREDHLVPLFFAFGAGPEEPCTCVYHETDFAGGITASSFRFG